ncbi:hypothetical protein C1646_632886, partial [Rhizophagus diaphanus]
ILPALTLDRFIAVDIFEGACNKNKFINFVLNKVVRFQYYLNFINYIKFSTVYLNIIP